MSPILLKLSKIMTKHCQISVAAAQDWDTLFSLERYCTVEIEIWRDTLRWVNARIVFIDNAPFISVYSDANDVACGHTFAPIDSISVGPTLSLPPGARLVEAHSLQSERRPNSLLSTQECSRWS